MIDPAAVAPVTLARPLLSPILGWLLYRHKMAVHCGKDAIKARVALMNDTGSHIIVRLSWFQRWTQHRWPSLRRHVQSFIEESGWVKAAIQDGHTVHLGAARMGKEILFVHQDRFQQMLNSEEPMWERHSIASLGGEIPFRLGDTRQSAGVEKLDHVGRFLRVAVNGTINLPKNQPFRCYIDGKAEDGRFTVYCYRFSTSGAGYIVLYRVED